MTRAGLGARTNTPYYQSPLIYETLYLVGCGVRCTVEPDLTAFAAAALPWLAREPVVHNVIATLVGTTLDGSRPVRPGEPPLWVTVLDDAGDIVGVAVRTPPHKLLLSRMPAATARALADRLAATGIPLPGVSGPVPLPAEFAAHWSADPPGRAERTRGLRMYACDDVRPLPDVPGRARRATGADVPLLVEWAAAFSRDTCTPPAAAPGATALADMAGRVGTGRMLLWEDADGPVSMATWFPPAAGVRRVSYVYTPPAARRRGYASAVTAAATRHALADVRLCMLYTDLANPTSNAIYQRIGYRAVADSEEWTFSGT